MSFQKRAVLLMLTAALTGTSHAQGMWEDEAVDAIKAMDAYIDGMKTFVVEVEAYRDAEIGPTLTISNPSMSRVVVDRSGSMRSTTDGVLRKTEIVINDGALTVYTDDRNLYARADVPEELDDALLHALDEYDVETPALDLLLIGSLEYIVGEEDDVIYVSGSGSVRGVDCHHVLIAGQAADLQLWIAKGDKPTPVRSVMTLNTPMRPSVEQFINWEAKSVRASEFNFEPPDGAREIAFVESE